MSQNICQRALDLPLVLFVVVTSEIICPRRISTKMNLIFCVRIYVRKLDDQLEKLLNVYYLVTCYTSTCCAQRNRDINSHKQRTSSYMPEINLLRKVIFKLNKRLNYVFRHC